MTSKERVRLILSGEKADRLGKAEALWPRTRRRWRKEGLPEGVHPSDYFSMDVRRMLNIDASRDAAVEEARRRIRAGRRARGHMFHSDHSLPPTVSFENYSVAMEVFEEESWL